MDLRVCCYSSFGTGVTFNFIYLAVLPMKNIAMVLCHRYKFLLFKRKRCQLPPPSAAQPLRIIFFFELLRFESKL